MAFQQTKIADLTPSRLGEISPVGRAQSSSVVELGRVVDEMRDRGLGGANTGSDFCPAGETLR